MKNFSVFQPFTPSETSCFALLDKLRILHRYLRFTYICDWQFISEIFRRQFIVRHLVDGICGAPWMRKEGHDKGQLISKKNVKPRILPKNERMNSFLLVCDVFSFVFLKNPRPEKKLFEIIWPLTLAFEGITQLFT